jgi:hypothetical protein
MLLESAKPTNGMVCNEGTVHSDPRQIRQTFETTSAVFRGSKTNCPDSVALSLHGPDRDKDTETDNGLDQSLLIRPYQKWYLTLWNFREVLRRFGPTSNQVLSATHTHRLPGRT